MVVLLATALACPEALARIVGTADIEDCIISNVITCETKKVVTVAVTHGLQTEFEAIGFAGGPVKLILNKTAPVLKYPLKYLHTVKPTTRSKTHRDSAPTRGCGNLHAHPGAVRNCWASIRRTPTGSARHIACEKAKSISTAMRSADTPRRTILTLISGLTKVRRTALH
jgi:hypothetical protein